MSHYSDIGFGVKNEKDWEKLFKKIVANKDFMQWDIDEGKGENNPVLEMRKFGGVRYFIKVGNEGVESLAPAQDNERISYASLKYSDDIKNKDGYPIVELIKEENEFPTIMITKQDIPFWFCSPNAEIFFQTSTEPESDTLKICGFANYVKVKERDLGQAMTLEQLQKKRQRGELRFADESYVSNFNGNKTIAFVSGIIKDAKALKNPLTKKKYYTVDVDCLGLYFKMLIDPKLIKFKELKVGNVLFGEFWNVAVLVADNHPDYF